MQDRVPRVVIFTTAVFSRDLPFERGSWVHVPAVRDRERGAASTTYIYTAGRYEELPQNFEARLRTINFAFCDVLHTGLLKYFESNFRVET